MAEGTMGWLTRFGLGATAAAAATREFETLSNGLIKDAQHLDVEGMRGDRGYRSEDVVEGVYTVGGPVVLEPRPDDLAFLLPYILGAAASGTTFAVAATLPDLIADAVKGLSSYRYAGVKVNQATFRSAMNGKLTLTMDLQGKTETSGITFPSISSSLSALQPYVHHQLVATIGGTAYKVDNVEVTIANNLKLNRHYNTQTRQSLPEGSRVISVALDVPFTTDEASLYDIAVAGLGTNTLVWTNGNYSFTITLANLKAPTKGPPIQSRGEEVGFRLNFVARSSGSTQAIVCTNDSTG